MQHYDYPQRLRAIWEHGVANFEQAYSAEVLFDDEARNFLHSLGLSPYETYDFIKHFLKRGEPDFATFLLLSALRRAYFREVQGGQPSSTNITSNELPERTAEAGGIAWLPRIMAKAKAKLRGELDKDLLYFCPGDRNFLKEHDLHPADFLAHIWRTENNPDAVVAWVKANSKAAKK